MVQEGGGREKALYIESERGNLIAGCRRGPMCRWTIHSNSTNSKPTLLSGITRARGSSKQYVLQYLAGI